jgi:mono/diheme cytochrome c family protein
LLTYVHSLNLPLLTSHGTAGERHNHQASIYSKRSGQYLGEWPMRTLESLALIGVSAIFGAIAAGTYFFGGYYSVAGTAPDPSPVAWALAHVRTTSIERHAKDNPPLSLDDSAIVQAGAQAFSERGCVHCHGGAGVKWAKFSEGLHPDPPDLKEVANERTPNNCSG